MIILTNLLGEACAAGLNLLMDTNSQRTIVINFHQNFVDNIHSNLL
jgi:hypothetical protein